MNSSNTLSSSINQNTLFSSENSLIPPTLETLPPELLQKIFTFLSSSERMNLTTCSKHLHSNLKQLAISELKILLRDTSELRINLNEMPTPHLLLAKEIKIGQFDLPETSDFSKSNPPFLLQEIQSYIESLQKLTKNEVVLLINNHLLNFPPTLLKIWENKYPEEGVSAKKHRRNFEIVLKTMNKQGRVIEPQDLLNTQKETLEAIQKNTPCLDYSSAIFRRLFSV